MSCTWAVGLAVAVYAVKTESEIYALNRSDGAKGRKWPRSTTRIIGGRLATQDSLSRVRKRKAK